MKTGKELRSLTMQSDALIEQAIQTIEDSATRAARKGQFMAFYRMDDPRQFEKIKGKMPGDIQVIQVEEALIKISW